MGSAEGGVWPAEVQAHEEAVPVGKERLGWPVAQRGRRFAMGRHVKWKGLGDETQRRDREGEIV